MRVGITFDVDACTILANLLIAAVDVTRTERCGDTVSSLTGFVIKTNVATAAAVILISIDIDARSIAVIEA